MNQCWCNLPLEDKWGYKMCPNHGANWRFEPVKPPKRDRIPKYSGRSKKGIKGAYEND